MSTDISLVRLGRSFCRSSGLAPTTVPLSSVYSDAFTRMVEEDSDVGWQQGQVLQHSCHMGALASPGRCEFKAEVQMQGAFWRQVLFCWSAYVGGS